MAKFGVAGERVISSVICGESGYDAVIPQLGIDFGQLWLLSGPLGVGKTTFVRRVLKWMGYSGRVKSPTFNYMFEYRVGGGIVLHVDLYRLQFVDDTILLPIDEALESGALVFVEWPEKFSDNWMDLASEVFVAQMEFTDRPDCRLLQVEKLK